MTKGSIVIQYCRCVYILCYLQYNRNTNQTLKILILLDLFNVHYIILDYLTSVFIKMCFIVSEDESEDEMEGEKKKGGEIQRER